MDDGAGDVVGVDVAGIGAEQNSDAAVGADDDDVGSAELADGAADVGVGDVDATGSCEPLLVAS